ncbi:cytochrome P450 [Xylaria intraflava]|nr:cytochrome P450 [Xylaria intraflava]
MATPVPDFAGGLTAVAILLSTSIVWYVLSAIRSWHRLRQFPGPFLASFSHIWGYFAMRSGRVHLIFHKEQEKHGKLVRIGPNELLTCDAKSLWHMNNVRLTYGRGGWYAGLQLDPHGRNVASECSVTKHDNRKAKLAAGYAGKGALDLEAQVDSQVAVLVGLLKSKYLAKGKPQFVDLSRLITFFQVDIITLVGFGEPWGDLASDSDVFDWISIMGMFAPFGESIIMVPFLRDVVWTGFLLKLAGRKISAQKGLGKVLTIIDDLVAKRFDTATGAGHNQDCMLDMWIKNGLTRRECEIELALLLPAGLETMATAISNTMFHLLSAPTAYQRLQDEITMGIQDGRISSPITNNEAKQLPYLQAVISEGLRMLPPLITGLPKTVPAGGDTICGQFVPEGTDVFVNVYTLLRDKEVFGEDADVFRPERFLECSAEERSEMMKNVDLAFGHGRWACLGKTLAMLELNKVLVEMLRICDMQIANPLSPCRVLGYTTCKVKGLLVSIRNKAQKA